jgi:large subunit ribosomal protein L6
MKKNINIVKVPDKISIYYCKEKNILIITGPIGKKSVKLKPEFQICRTKNYIYIDPIHNLKISSSKKKSLFALQGTLTALIKQFILETSYIFYKKLKLIGVGYRIFDVEKFKGKLLLFKLGYSHFIYFKIPIKSKLFCLKNTKLFISGNSYHNITQSSSCIRAYKKPEPYKGKGILYNHEKIIFKEGKKV